MYNQTHLRVKITGQFGAEIINYASVCTGYKVDTFDGVYVMRNANLLQTNTKGIFTFQRFPVDSVLFMVVFWCSGSKH